MTMSLDPTGKAIIYGKKPYYATDEYKQNLQKRIVWIMKERWEEDSEAEDIISTYTKPATQEEREEIVESIEKDCILPFDPADLSMFKSDILISWISQSIKTIWESNSPYFLYLWSAKDLWKKREWWWESTLWPIEIDISQYKNQTSPTLNENEKKDYNLNPYTILMKVNYNWKDESETLPLKDQNETRQWRKKYDISFVVLEDTNKTPWHTLINQWFHVNKKAMNKEEFIKWFEENKRYATIPTSISNSI